jgi:RND family efflux transporter MFP subunit
LTAEANFLRLTAPTDGRVVKRDGEVGQLIPANQAVLWLTRNDPLRISSAIDEEDIARVAVGQPVLVRADAFPGQVFHGRLQAITPMGDSVARSYRVRIEMTEHTPLLIGMTVETNVIIREDHDALLVPTTAVDNGRVWQVIDGKLTATPVKIGVKGADRTEILDGLPGDATIVVKPAASFADGERVRVRTVTAK